MRHGETFNSSRLYVAINVATELHIMFCIKDVLNTVQGAFILTSIT